MFIWIKGLGVVLILGVSVLVIGLLLEAPTNQGKSTENLTIRLLYNVKGVFTGINKYCKRNKDWERCHWFDESFSNRLKKTVVEYVATGFDVECIVASDRDIKNPARYISIKFPGNKVFTDEELRNMTCLEHMQLKRYLSARQFMWKTFSTYDYDGSIIHIMLYYAEFEWEEPYILYRYKVRMREEMPQTCGTLVDEGLNKELEEEDKEKGKGAD